MPKPATFPDYIADYIAGSFGAFPAGTALAAYLGQVATRSYVSNTFNTTNKQSMSRNGHVARDNISSLQIAIPNWYCIVGVETGTGAPVTVTASVEYPAGTFAQVLFSGSSSAAIPDVTTLLSDSVSVNIPSGASFWTRIFWTSTAGILFSTNNVAANGDGYDSGVSGLTDKTLGGVVAPSALAMPPIAIVAKTKLASVGLIGDSRVFGQGDTPAGNGDVGELARSIGPAFAYQNMGCPSDSAVLYTTHSTLRRASLYCSHFILQNSINDLIGGQSVAQIQANLLTARNFFSGSPVFLSTTVVDTTSTDSWATTTNQTTKSFELLRTQLNDWKRTAPAGFTNYFEVANAVEVNAANTLTQDGGLWIVTGAANYGTTDGLHETAATYVLIQNSGGINTALIHR